MSISEVWRLTLALLDMGKKTVERKLRRNGQKEQRIGWVK